MEKSGRREVEIFILLVKSGPWPVFVNKTLLESSHTYSFCYCLWLLCATKAELNSCDGDHLACKTENIYYLYRKSLLTSDLKG